MKVVIVNHSDIRGGASTVSVRLLQALVGAGVDARMIVGKAEGAPDPNICQIGGNLRSRVCFLAECAEIFASDGFSRKNLFKLSTGRFGMPLHRHPWIRQADVVVLNWVNQGMLSLNEIRRIGAGGKALVWVMHDMWNMTGVCHHAAGCRNFHGRCGDCPLLGFCRGPRDLSFSVHRHKSRLYSSTPIHFVAVSDWLRRMASDSSLLKDMDVRTIHNPFPTDSYSISPSLSRSQLGLPDGPKLVTMCAARLDDPIKNLPAAVEAFNNIADSGAHPDIHAVFVGDIRDASALDSLHLPFTWLGTVSDPARLADIYASSFAVLSSSDYESLPTTLVEGLGAGALAVSFGGDGRDDIISHLSNGYLARHGDTRDLADGIVWARSCGISRIALHDSADIRFSSAVIARKYISLFNEILKH